MLGDLKKSILLVEDEIFIALKEKKDLEKYGYTVHHASSGEKALQCIVQDDLPIDLILMDINLGSGIDGTKAAEQILQHRHVPIVFLSSHTEPDVVEKTEKITSYGYVVKNSSITVLDASIKMALKLFDAHLSITHHQERLREINRIGKPSSSTIDTHVLLKSILEQTLQTLGASVGMIFLNDHETQTLSWAVSLGLSQAFVEEYSSQPIRWGEGLTGQIVVTKKPIFIPRDSAQDPRIARAITKEEGLNSFIGVPILADNQVVGVLNILTKPPLELTEEDVVFCAAIGGQVGWAINNARLHKDQARSEERFRLLFEKAEFSFSLYECIFDENHTLVDLAFLEVNQAYEKSIGHSAREVSGKTLLQVFPDTESYWLKEFSKVITTENPLHYQNYSKELKQQIELFVYTPQKGQLAIIGLNLTDHKQITITHSTAHTGAKSDNHQQYKELVALIPVGVYVLLIRTDGTMDFEFVSDRWCEIHNLDRDELLRDVSLAFNQVHPDEREIFIELNKDVARHPRPFRWEGRFILGDGNLHWHLIESTPVLLENGDTRWYGVVHDITEQKDAEKIIQKQLTEKETLLREVNHRVKNNIANIESLLTLQIDSTKESNIKDALMLAVSRIRPMRVLYEKLLITDGYRSVSMQAYITNLIDSLELIFASQNTIMLKTSISNFEIDAKKAISIGIIINELVTNAFKYAFQNQNQDQNNRTIQITIEDVDHHVWLLVQDNGIGFNLNTIHDQAFGFGLTLVKLLVEQLDGTLEMQNDPGAKTIIRFPLT